MKPNHAHAQKTNKKCKKPIKVINVSPEPFSPYIFSFGVKADYA